MRRVARAATATLLALTMLIALSGCGASTTQPTVGVSAVGADPTAFTGQIAIEGVVQKIDSSGNQITIIDLLEYETCGLTLCNSAAAIPLAIPTSGEPSPGGALYKGKLPAVEDKVVAVGEIKSSGQGLYFDVDRIERGSSVLIKKKR